MNKTIGVMGCGWLGLPLAKNLLKTGYSVRGSTTSDSKVSLIEENGIAPYLISLGEENIEGNINSFLKGLDSIVINVPPGLRGDNTSNYVKKMKLLHEMIKLAGVSEVLFVSSISVYGSMTGLVNESTTPIPSSASGKQLLESESIFRQDQSLKTAIIRFGGLIGPGRHPAIQLSGRKDLKNGQHPVNLIHLEDCIRIIATILENGWWGGIFNGVYPDHPIKQQYYTSEAENMGLKALHYSKESNGIEGKTVEGANLTIKGFTFSKGIWS